MNEREAAALIRDMIPYPHETSDVNEQGFTSFLVHFQDEGQDDEFEVIVRKVER